MPPKTTPPRQGPRPLTLHMTVQWLTTLGSLAALPPSRNGSPPSRPSSPAWPADLTEALKAADPDRLARAVAAEAWGRTRRFADGVLAYRHHPHRRTLETPPVLWSAGTTRLLDYGTTAEASAAGPPVLVVPSLINRYHILDLTADRSLLRYLAARGLRPFVVDWDAPGPEEEGFDVAAYITRRLEPALDAVTAETGRTPAVAGYCMGGTLAAGLAARRPDGVAALATLAAPWDFHAAAPEHARLLAEVFRVWDTFLPPGWPLPVDAIQALFALVDPQAVPAKFRRFADRADNGRAARHFVALEDWLNDGVPLARPVARECLTGWYGANTPGRGAWHVAGTPVHPETLACPALALVPRGDRLVPPESARALTDRAPRPRMESIPAGHIGMIAGARARGRVYWPLARWLRGRLRKTA